MSDKPLLTIAIPTYENYRQLVDCLSTLVLYCEYPYRIVVVNNGRPCDSDGVPFERSLRNLIRHPELTVIQAEKNLGWQRSINKVFLEECDTPYFAMMNDDIVFVRAQGGQMLRELCASFKHPEIGAIGPVTNFAMGSQNHLCHTLPGIHTTTLLIGFCMIVRSEAFAQVGGLDEGLPGGDDLDLSILLTKAGYKLIVHRGCYVHHYGCQTGARVTDYWNSQWHIETTNNALIRKHGVRAWYECLQSKVDIFQPITQHHNDAEGTIIREWVAESETVVDIGCGSNKTLPRAIGVDHTPAGNIGRAGGQRGMVSVADHIGDASHLPFEDNSVDAMIARHIFEHLLDPLTALDEWSRVLKPDGILTVACPNQDSYNTVLVDFTHVHAYNPDSLVRLLDRFGFRVEDVKVVHPGLSFVVKARKPVDAPRLVRKPEMAIA